MEMTFFLVSFFSASNFIFCYKLIFFSVSGLFSRFFSFVKLLTLILCCGHVSSGRGMGRAYTND